tara:strand:+ start:394 stop:546 length:153 start_codon:yes stop_codon:yes gene_type:complete
MPKKKKKTTSEKVIDTLKQEASKRTVGKVIGLTRNQEIQKAMEREFGSSF